jgi:ribosomal protein L11 methyltransferase
MKYYEFIINTNEAFGDEKELMSPILTAELADLGFESFVEEENFLKAYILEEELKEESIADLYCLNGKSYQLTKVKDQNWNEEWEKNYPLIQVGDSCCIRASFHPKQEVEYDILINPKMSFGTGHHETTFLMTSFLLENEVKDQKVLDMGCGTAVLGILAKMKGASYVEAIDIDEWAFENSIENTELNNQDIVCKLGGAEVISDVVFDTILANINRNILLNDMEAYSAKLKSGGQIFLSGFYHSDIETLVNHCSQFGLELINQKEKNHWVSLQLIKA